MTLLNSDCFDRLDKGDAGDRADHYGPDDSTRSSTVVPATSATVERTVY